MDHLVSIIVPVYNVQQYLSALLETLIHQTYHHLQIILVDDGSTDDSGKICDRYAEQDARVYVIHQKNAGAANAKNAGLDAARGDYIAFADSDDWVEKHWIEEMLNCAKTCDADVVECSFFLEFTNRTELGNSTDAFVNNTFQTADYLRQYPHMWTNALFWNKLFHARCLRDIRFHTERRCVDDEFFTYKAVSGANCVTRIPQMLYHYRQRRSSVTQMEKTLYQRTVDDIDVLAERHMWMKKYYPDIAMDYLRHDVGTLLYLAAQYPFNREAIARFRKTARYYFGQCMYRYPGKLTLFYAVRALLLPSKRFGAGYQASKIDDLQNYFP